VPECTDVGRRSSPLWVVRCDLRAVSHGIRRSPATLHTARNPISSCVIRPQAEPERSNTGRPNLSVIARRPISLFRYPVLDSSERRARELSVSAAISRFPDVELGEFRNTRDTLTREEAKSAHGTKGPTPIPQGVSSIAKQNAKSWASEALAKSG
jgi:hypothetical protein